MEDKQSQKWSFWKYFYDMKNAWGTSMKENKYVGLYIKYGFKYVN